MCLNRAFRCVNMVILQFAMRASYQRKIRATATARTAPAVDAATCRTGRHIVHSSPSRPVACFLVVLSVNHCGVEQVQVE